MRWGTLEKIERRLDVGVGPLQGGMYDVVVGWVGPRFVLGKGRFPLWRPKKLLVGGFVLDGGGFPVGYVGSNIVGENPWTGIRRWKQ